MFVSCQPLLQIKMKKKKKERKQKERPNEAKPLVWLVIPQQSRGQMERHSVGRSAVSSNLQLLWKQVSKA